LKRRHSRISIEFTYNFDDGEQIEPSSYAPIIPMVLVNGAEGIATGWSTFIPTFKPQDIIDNLIRLLDNKPLVEMAMWSNGFSGKISIGEKKISTFGIVQKKDKKVIITELPLRKWTDDYKKWLIDGEFKFNEYHTDKSVHFEIREDLEVPDLISHFKLENSFSLTNMTLFDIHGNIKQYKSVLDIISEFYTFRLEMYDKRKASMLQKMHREMFVLKEKLRFLVLIVTGKLDVYKQTKSQILEKLNTHGFENVEGLLNIPIWSMTSDSVKKLEESIATIEKEHNSLSEKDGKSLWRDDLNILSKKLTN
jgi:DNA topoisomerase-2